MASKATFLEFAVLSPRARSATDASTTSAYSSDTASSDVSINPSGANTQCEVVTDEDQDAPVEESSAVKNVLPKKPSMKSKERLIVHTSFRMKILLFILQTMQWATFTCLIKLLIDEVAKRARASYPDTNVDFLSSGLLMAYVFVATISIFRFDNRLEWSSASAARKIKIN